MSQAEEDGITLGTQHTHGTSDSPMGLPQGNDDTIGPLPDFKLKLKRRVSITPTPANTPTWSRDRNISEQLNATHLHSHLGEFTDDHQDSASVIWERTLRR